MPEARFRTIIEVLHDMPHEQLPIFHMLVGNQVRVLATESVDAKIPRIPPHPKALPVPGETRAERKRRVNNISQKSRNATKRERWEAMGLVVSKEGFKERIDVDASLEKLGMTREQVMTMRHTRGTPAAMVEKAMRRSGKPRPRKEGS